MTNRKEPIPAIFYARVSTDGQDRKLSYEEQEELGREMARKEGYNIMRFLREVASATGTDKRPVFRDAMNLAMSPKHPARALLFHDLSRAFRDDEDFYINRRALREANVEICTVEEGHLTEDDASQLMFGFKSILNSQSPRKTSRETRRGQFGATRRGYYIGPEVFGYEKYKVKVSDEGDDDEEGGEGDDDEEGGEGDVKGKRKREHTRLRAPFDPVGAPPDNMQNDAREPQRPTGSRPHEGPGRENGQGQRLYRRGSPRYCEKPRDSGEDSPGRKIELKVSGPGRPGLQQ